MQIRTFGWPGNRDEESKKIAVRANDYWLKGFLEPWRSTRVKGLRVVPVNETIAMTDGKKVVPYEDTVKILDGFSYFTVSHCPCRHIKNLDPAFPDSKYPSEVCLHFDGLGRYIVENGLGREISRQETESILRRSAEAGLVHSVSNQQEKADTICNCDREYCMWFTLHYKLNDPMSVVPSNYIIRTNSATCLGCGLCVKRCPMEAIHLEDAPGAGNKTGKVSVSDGARCIGCGVCAYKCKSDTLSLVRHGTAHEPPLNGRDFVMKFMADRNADNRS